jgi:hypothetical protein
VAENGKPPLFLPSIRYGDEELDNDVFGRGGAESAKGNSEALPGKGKEAYRESEAGNPSVKLPNLYGKPPKLYGKPNVKQRGR